MDYAPTKRLAGLIARERELYKELDGAGLDRRLAERKAEKSNADADRKEAAQLLKDEDAKRSEWWKAHSTAKAAAIDFCEQHGLDPAALRAALS